MPTQETRLVSFNDDKSIYIHPPEGVTPEPTPEPTPTPPPVDPNERVFPMPADGASTFFYFEAGVRYTFLVPPGPGSVELGEGQGAPVSAGKMSLSPQIGDWTYGADPANCISNPRDPNGPKTCPCATPGGQPPGKISWTRDPNDPYTYRCRLGQGQYYLMIQLDAAGSQVMTYRSVP